MRNKTPMMEQKRQSKKIPLLLLIIALAGSACSSSVERNIPNNKFQISERYSINVCQSKGKISRNDLQELKKLYSLLSLDDILRQNQSCRLQTDSGDAEELDFSSPNCVNPKNDACPVRLLKIPVR